MKAEVKAIEQAEAPNDRGTHCSTAMSSKMTPGTSAPPAVIRRRMTGKQPEHAEERAKKVENPKAVEQNTKKLEEDTSETTATKTKEAAKALEQEAVAKPKGTKTEATKAAAKAKRTIESKAAAKQRLLSTFSEQLEGANSRNAECFTKLENKKADMNAAAQAAEHDGNWTNQCKVKKTISDHADASMRLKTWTDRVVFLQEAIKQAER